MTWRDGPHWAAFDLETTGVSIEDDRIVTACVALIDVTGKSKPVVKTALADPGIEIPQGATDVHGITTEHARTYGQPAAGLVEGLANGLLRNAANGTPIAGFNLAYDLSLLDRETRRYGQEPFGDRFLAAGGMVLDGFVLDKYCDPFRKGSRKLVDTCQHYDVRIDGAHDASHDALAAARVIYRIGQYGGMGVEWLTGTAKLKRDVASRMAGLAGLSLEQLHGLQVKAKADQAASFAAYLIKQGKPADDVRPEWPLVPCVDRQESLTP